MSKKLIALCILLLCFIGTGAFSLYMFLAESAETEDVGPYIYEALSVPVEEPPEEDDPFTFSYDAVSLLAQNADFLGWLAIPDTTINFPVVQGRDNQHYLSHAFDGSYSVFGCPFLDNRTAPDGDILVLHGHNMGSNRTEMFSTLLSFQDTAYAAAHNTAYFSLTSFTEGESEEFRLFAVLNLDVNSEFDYFRSHFDSEEDRAEFLSFLSSRSLYEADFTPENRILFLSTCNRAYGEDNRLLLVFGQTDISGESTTES